MISQDQFFELVSMVSTEKKKPNPLLDQSLEILSNIEQQAETIINHGGAQQRSELKSKLNAAIDEAKLQVYFPMLADHYNLVVTYQDKIDLKILDLFVQSVPEQLKETLSNLIQPKTPLLFYHSARTVNATVYNLVDNNVSLDSKELCDFLKLGVQDQGANSSKLALASSNSLAKLCAIPLKFNNESKQINVIFVNSQQVFTDKTVLQLLNLSQRVLVLADASTAPWDISAFPIKISVYTTPTKKALVKEYIESSLKLLSAKGHALVDISSCTRQTLQGLIKEMNVACDNLNIKTQILELDHACFNVINKNLLKSKHRLESFNSFLVESYLSDPFVQSLCEQEVAAIEKYESIDEQNFSVLQEVYDSLGKLEELFERRGCHFKESQSLSAGAVKVWRNLFELGAQSEDISLMQRSIQARKLSDGILVSLQQAYLNKMQSLEYQSKLQEALQGDGYFYDDEYRRSLLRLLDFEYIGEYKKLLSHINNKVPLGRRCAQENLLVGQYLMSRNHKLSRNAQKSFEVALYQGEERAIDYLVDSYVQEAQSTDNLSKLQELAQTFNPVAAYAYAKMLGAKHNEKKHQYLLIAACQSYRPAVDDFATKLYQGVISANVPLSPKMQVRAQQALSIYQWYDLNSKTTIARQGRLLCVLDRKSEAIPFLQQAAEHNDNFACVTLGAMYLKGEFGLAKDLDKAKFYLSKASPYYANGVFLRSELDSAIQSEQRAKSSSYNSSSSYSSYSYGGGGGSSMCFITTATCADQGKPDDCAELTMFRRFRDEILLNTDMGQKLVQEYYRIAPTIVKCIEQDPERKAIFACIYDKYITPAYVHLLNEDYEQARKMYISCVLRLANRYGIEVHDPNLLEAREQATVKYDNAQGESYLEL